MSRAQASQGRFGHLLNPIRDLAENWNIDVASELEEWVPGHLAPPHHRPQPCVSVTCAGFPPGC